MRAPITSITVVKDEPFIEHSLNSVKELVDKMVVVDASQRIPCRDVAERLRKHVRTVYLRYVGTPNYAAQYKVGFKHVDTRWVLTWDGDFVALPQLRYLLRNYICRLPNRHFYVEFYGQTVGKANYFHREAYLATWSPHLCDRSWFRTFRRKVRARIRGKKDFGSSEGKPDGGRPDVPFPLGYQRIRLDDVFFLHVAWRYD